MLFDIDGTLIATGGAGQRAMNRAFDDVFGIPDAFAGLELAGRTDSSILTDAFAGQGLAPSRPAVAAFRARYGECLAEEVASDGNGKRVMPGIARLLEQLSSERSTFLALLTGNYAEAARIKLEHFRLWQYFRCGAFGEDSHDRNHLVPVAVERARAAGLPEQGEACRVVVIGDTPRDVACAAAHGARSIAVATGPYPGERLSRAGADVVFEDLADTVAVLDALRALFR